MKLPFYLENERIRIYTDDGVAVTAAYRAENQKAPVIATAKCHPEDKFDFIVGAKLAMERLLKKLKWQPYLKYTYVNLRGTSNSVDIGKIGMPLKGAVDKNGAPLFIGDIVCHTSFNMKEFAPITLSHDGMLAIYDGLGFFYTLVKAKDCEKLIDYRDMLKDGMSVRVGRRGVIEYVTIMRE